VACIDLVTRIAAPRERCFDLARSVDLHVRSPRQTREVAISGRLRGLLSAGEDVTWRARHFGCWYQLTSEITAYERPSHFRDSMVRGPFRRLDHDHFFLDDGRGGTIMRDRLDYAAPAGLLGRLAELLVLNPYLARFLERRNQEIKAVAESEAWRELLRGV
jgi:ligand-binding SRPBCC domain-containing protein